MTRKPTAETNQESLSNRIRNYYDESRADYRWIWSRHHLHFGYWDEYTTTHAESLINMNRRVSEAAKLRPGMHVLDAGCGVGGFAVWLASVYGVYVDGVTIVQSQLDKARRHAQESGVAHRVGFHLEDYTATTFPSESFDAITAIESFCHAKDKPAFLKEAYRLLKPGGRLVVCDGFRTGRDYSQADEKLMRSWLDGWAVPDLATSEELASWASAHGFTKLSMNNIEASARPSHERLYRLAKLAWVPATLAWKLGLRNDTQHGNLRAARDQWHALQRDLWYQGIFIASKPDR